MTKIKARVNAAASKGRGGGSGSGTSGDGASAAAKRLAELESQSAILHAEAKLLLRCLAELDARIEGNPAPKRKRTPKQDKPLIPAAEQQHDLPLFNTAHNTPAAGGDSGGSRGSGGGSSLKAKMAARKTEMAESAAGEPASSARSNQAPKNGQSPLRAKIEAKKAELGFAPSGQAATLAKQPAPLPVPVPVPVPVAVAVPRVPVPVPVPETAKTVRLTKAKADKSIGLQLVSSSATGGTRICAVAPSCAASTNPEVVVGDVVLRVGSTDVSAMKVAAVKQLIARAGSTVNLVLQADASPILKRAVFNRCGGKVIGVQLVSAADDAAGGSRVLSIASGRLASRNPLLCIGDMVLSVNGTNVSAMKVAAVEQLIAEASAGGTVNLVVQADASPILKRAVFDRSDGADLVVSFSDRGGGNGDGTVDVFVGEVTAGSPPPRSNSMISKGDRILTINGVNTAGMVRKDVLAALAASDAVALVLVAGSTVAGGGGAEPEGGTNAPRGSKRGGQKQQQKQPSSSAEKSKVAASWLRDLKKRASKASKASKASRHPAPAPDGGGDGDGDGGDGGGGRRTKQKKAAAAAALRVESLWRASAESNIQLLQQLLMSSEDIKIREQVRARLEERIQNNIDGAGDVCVATFGSTVSGLAGTKSDVDLVLVVPRNLNLIAGLPDTWRVKALRQSLQLQIARVWSGEG